MFFLLDQGPNGDPFSRTVAPRPGPLDLDRGVAAELVVRCAIEDIIGCVRRFGDLPDDGAVSRGSLAAHRVDALDKGDVGENAGALSAQGHEPHPWDSGFIHRNFPGDGSDHFASAAALPTRTRKMTGNEVAFAIEEGRIGHGAGPG